MNDPAAPWPEFPDAVSRFLCQHEAVALYAIMSARRDRTEQRHRGRYAEDPTIMGWQLANEPRPGGSDAVVERDLPAYHEWIDDSARLIQLARS